MAGEWQNIRLGEVCLKIGSGATPRGGSEVYLQDGPYSLIRSQNVYNGGFHRDGLAFIGEKHAAELCNVEVLEGDVLLNITGDSVARACQVDPGVLPARVNQHVAIIRPDSERLDSRFLRYYLVSPEMQTKLLSWAGSGGTRNALTKGMIESFDVLVPTDIPEQRFIAHILGTLDDKIEMNRRMNETLEAMAQAVFKSWFVDFEPVRVKAEGRWRQGESLPGLPAHLFDLFPDSFEDSELGEIPEGWEVASIGAVAEVIDCLHSKKPERRDSGLPLLQLENIRDDGLLDMEDTYYIAESDYEKWITRMEASPGDCVITNVGRVGAVSQIPLGQRAALGRNMTGLRCLGDFPYPTVLLECLLSCKMKDEIALKMDTGTILDALNVRNIPLLRFVKATCDVLNVFERLCRPSRRRMEMLIGESRTLASLRDTLLPKLISGELRVDAADKANSRIG